MGNWTVGVRVNPEGLTGDVKLFTAAGTWWAMGRDGEGVQLSYSADIDGREIVRTLDGLNPDATFWVRMFIK